MLSKIKKYFFGGIFFLLYVSFLAQFVYIVASAGSFDTKMISLGLLSGEWLVLIAARYLAKKSSNGSNAGAGYARHGNHFRR